MELQWYDIRELTEDAALAVMGMMDETRRRRVADIAGEDDRKRTIAGELLARQMLAARLGVDVEVVRSAQEKFMRRVCSQQEMACIRPGDDGDCRRFWEIWTAKEALFKLTGKGPLLKLSRFALPERVALDYMEKNGCALTVAAEIL